MGKRAGNEVPDGPPLIDWGVAESAAPGGATSGDLSLVKSFPGGILLAVVDGLGHGEGAAVAARQAIGILEAHAQEPVIALVERCHRELRQTRGVVMSLASYSATDRTLTWLGVGNVEGALQRAGPPADRALERLISFGGVVGDRLPSLRAGVLTVAEGDTLVFATDGIRAEFSDELSALGSPQQIADRILEEFSKGTDDALVLVARYLGAR